MRDGIYDVVIVGAGPAGLIAARETAKKDVEVILLEEHNEIGHPCHCAGLLSLKGLNIIGIPPDLSFVQNKIKSAKIFSPSGIMIKIEKDSYVACVVDRVKFDKYLAEQAKKLGVHIKLGWKARIFNRTNKRITLSNEREKIFGNLLINAEGSSGRILKEIGLSSSRRNVPINGVQYRLNDVKVDPDCVEIHLGHSIAPGLFAWIIPINENSAKVGLGCSGVNPNKMLHQFIKKRFKKRVTNNSNFHSWPIITTGLIEKTFDNQVLIVGDAAGQTKPTTGGGVIIGGICAIIAGKVAVKAVKQNDYSSKFLMNYNTLCENKIGKDLRAMLLARRVIDNLTDNDFDRFFRIIVKENLTDIISSEGDLDFQENIINKILRNKKIFRVFPLFLKALLFSRKNL